MSLFATIFGQKPDNMTKLFFDLSDKINKLKAENERLKDLNGKLTATVKELQDELLKERTRVPREFC